MSQLIESPYPAYQDAKGDPLENGYIYIGVSGLEPETNPISVYWDSGLSFLAAQPIRTLAGIPSRNGSAAALFALTNDYSIKILDKNKELIYSSLVSTSQIAESIWEYDSITDLKAITIDVIPNNQLVFVKGNTEVGDEGGGIFRWDSTSTSTDNNDTIIKITAVTTGRMLRMTKNMVTVNNIANLKIAPTGITVNVLGYYAAGDGGGGQFYWDTTSTDADNGGTIIQATGVVTGRWIRVYTGFLNVRWFGTVGDGVSDDSANILAALAVSNKIEFDPSDTYFLGTFPDTGATPKFIITTDDTELKTNGCNFTANASLDPSYDNNNSGQTIFRFEDASNVTIGDFTLTANQIERDTGTIGIQAIHIRNVAANMRWITIGNIKTIKTVSSVQVGSSDPATYRARGIRIASISADGGYYGLNCVNNGDDIVGVINGNNLVRIYFVYGIEGHNLKLFSTNHAKFQDINISYTNRTTRDITLDYNAVHSVSDAPIHLNDLSGTGTGTISNIEINGTVTMSNSANPTVWFSIYDGVGAFTDGGTLFDNIRLNGVTNSARPIVFNSDVTGDNLSNLHISKSYQAGMNEMGRYIINKDYRSRYSANVYDNATTLDLYFNVSDLQLSPSWGMLTIWGGDNPGSDETDYVIQRYELSFTVNSLGDVAIHHTNQMHSYAAGEYASTSFPAQTGTYNLLIQFLSVTAWASTARIKGTLEIFGNQEKV